MVNIFIIHGSFGNPNENWFPWLKSELQELNNSVFSPTFPTPENQNVDVWFNIFQPYFNLIDEDTILIGHSVGVAFLLTVLEELDKPIKAAFFIAGFTGLLNNEKFDKVNKSFTEKKFDWDKINKNCKEIHVLHSDNDPYVPIQKAKELAKNLNTDITLIKNAGHFGEQEFNILLEKIKEIL